MPVILIKKTAEEPGAASLAVTVPVEQVQQAEDRATSAYQRRARLPGFRKGKAPAAIVKKHFADDIRQEALQELIRESWKVAVEQESLGMLPGETVDAIVRFPDDFPEEAKRGQTREIRLTLHEVKRQHLPELDDAFAREVGDFDSLDALKHAIREDLERDAEREADAKVRADLIEQIVAANRVVAPKPLVERALWVFAQAYGIPEDRMSQFAAALSPAAEAQVRRDLVLDYVVEQQGLQATEAELDGRIQELAERRGMPAEQLYASLEKAKRLRDVERSITEEKVFAFLLSQSTVEHV